MKDKIEQARSETIYSDGRQRYIFLKEELLSLLKEVAEKAFNVGYDQIEYPAETAFADYWESVTDKIK